MIVGQKGLKSTLSKSERDLFFGILVPCLIQYSLALSFLR